MSFVAAFRLEMYEAPSLPQRQLALCIKSLCLAAALARNIGESEKEYNSGSSVRGSRYQIDIFVIMW